MKKKKKTIKLTTASYWASNLWYAECTHCKKMNLWSDAGGVDAIQKWTKIKMKAKKKPKKK